MLKCAKHNLGFTGAFQTLKELQMAHHQQNATKLKPFFWQPQTSIVFLSSSGQRVARFGGSVDHLVPQHVAQDIYHATKLIQNRP